MAAPLKLADGLKVVIDFWQSRLNVEWRLYIPMTPSTF